jgi:Fe-S oxidoreductase
LSELKDVLSMCVLCPGICVTECPVYMATRIRASSPNNLARIALKYMDGSENMEEALWLCTGCRSCENACPLGNRLWDAVRILRGNDSDKDVRLEIERILDNRKPGLLIVSSNKPGDNIIDALGRDYSLYWIDSRVIGNVYWNGGNPILDLNGIEAFLFDDMDALVSLSSSISRLISPLHILKHSGVQSLFGDKGYTLHIPCKTPKEYRETVTSDALSVLGTPELVVDRCIAGGGGLPLRHPDLAREIAISTMRDADPGKPVITLCSNAKMLLEKLGYRALTLLDLLGEVMQK